MKLPKGKGKLINIKKFKELADKIKEEDWEKEFEKRFVVKREWRASDKDYEDIVDFIRSLLKSTTEDGYARGFEDGFDSMPLRIEVAVEQERQRVLGEVEKKLNKTLEEEFVDAKLRSIPEGKFKDGYLTGYSDAIETMADEFEKLKEEK